MDFARKVLRNELVRLPVAFNDMAALDAGLLSAGVRPLVNTAVQVDGAELWVAGVDDLTEGRPDLRAALAGVPDEPPLILLAHNPDIWLDRPRGRGRPRALGPHARRPGAAPGPRRRPHPGHASEPPAAGRLVRARGHAHVRQPRPGREHPAAARGAAAGRVDPPGFEGVSEKRTRTCRGMAWAFHPATRSRSRHRTHFRIRHPWCADTVAGSLPAGSRDRPGTNDTGRHHENHSLLRRLEHLGLRPATAGRYPLEARWVSVLARELGSDYLVIPEGLNGRTTVWPDPVEGEYKSGKTYLIPCLESHYPVDLVVMMLGTNDLKHRFGLSAWDIAHGAGTLVEMIQGSAFGPDLLSPECC